MAKFAVFNSSLGTAAARPVVDDFDVDDLPEETFAARLADAVSDIPGGFGYILLTAGTYFSDLDGDASTYEYTVDTRGAPDAPPPVNLNPVTVDRYNLEEKQSQVKNRRDLLLLEALQFIAGDRRMTEADLGTITTYFNSLRAIPDAPASPDTVVFPTLGALANNASENLLTRSYRKGNILAAVALASGVPTGGIIETGTNVNGLYMRFADGGQICRARITPGFFNSTRLATTWTFPAAFHSLSSFSFGATFSTHNNSNAVDGLADTVIRQCEVMSRERSTTAIGIHVLSPTYSFVSGDFVWLDIWAIGRWTL